MKKIYARAVIGLVVLAPCQMAYANVPLGAAAFLAYPTFSYFQSSVVALLIVCALEAIAFYFISGTTFVRSFFGVVLANLFSSVLGVLLVLSFSSSLFFLIAFIPIAMFLRKMYTAITTAIKTCAVSRFQSLGVSIALLVLSGIFAGILLPLTSESVQKHSSPPSHILAVFAVLSLIVIGFVLTVLSETYLLIRLLKSEDHLINRRYVIGAIVMNVVSYAVLFVMYGRAVYNNIFLPSQAL